MKNDTKFSLIICTYNQCNSLEKVLYFLSEQLLDDNSIIELIVVDNNSSDETKLVCERGFKNIKFECSYIFERTQGLSIARNRGVKEAKGSILIFTDDDARLPKEWLQTMISTFEKNNADCVYGKIIIDWEKEIPEWYSDHFGSMFVALDYGESLFIVTDFHHEFYGKNFSVKKEFINSIGGFDPNLGRKGERLFIGEETRIYRSLITNEKKVVYCPESCVYHMLKDQEYTIENFERRYFDACISEYHMLRESSRFPFFGRPPYVIKKVLLFFLAAPIKIAQHIHKMDTRKKTYFRLEARKHLQLFLLWIKNTPH